MMSDELSCNPF